MKATDAAGFEIEKGKYGGTYAQEETAIHFMNWFDASFYVYFIKNSKRCQMVNCSFIFEKLRTILMKLEIGWIRLLGKIQI